MKKVEFWHNHFMTKKKNNQMNLCIKLSYHWQKLLKKRKKIEAARKKAEYDKKYKRRKPVVKAEIDQFNINLANPKMKQKPK